MEISEIRTAAPAEGRAAVELETFALLDRLHIPYAWVAHETADTIADCDVVSEVLGISICKNLFLCNRQKTAFYLLTMRRQALPDQGPQRPTGHHPPLLRPAGAYGVHAPLHPRLCQRAGPGL